MISQKKKLFMILSSIFMSGLFGMDDYPDKVKQALSEPLQMKDLSKETVHQVRLIFDSKFGLDAIGDDGTPFQGSVIAR